MNQTGHFGQFGGRYVPEMLIPALEELEKAYALAKEDGQFLLEYKQELKNYNGRPTPLYFCANLTKQLGGAKIYLKNEGLNHTGAHKITHCLGQALIAKRMGKKRLIAETGAGQHGLATATVAAKYGFSCTVYMGKKDYDRQRPNVFWMEKLGAEVVPVYFGSQTLKDAVNAALKDWMSSVGDTHYLLGSCVGPHPFPTMNRDFQSIVGQEIKQQILEREGRLPDYVVACVGGGSNAMGAFYPFVEDKSVSLIGVEAGGRSLAQGENAIRFAQKQIGVVEGYKSYFVQDDDGQIASTSSVSAGLDYAGVGPEVAYLESIGRLKMVYAFDKDVLNAFKILARTEGIIPALESAHAVAETIRLAPTLSSENIIVMNISGRGDKDIFIVAQAFEDKEWRVFCRRQSQKQAFN